MDCYKTLGRSDYTDFRHNGQTDRLIRVKNNALDYCSPGHIEFVCPI